MRFVSIGFLVLSFWTGCCQAMQGLAFFDDPKYGAKNTHFDYVNPLASKGGKLRLGVSGTFNTLDPTSQKGIIAESSFLLYESLLKRSLDEPFSLYGWLSNSFKLADDRLSITFNVHPKARFQDGTPVLGIDVIKSFQAFRDHGPFNTRTYYRQIKGADLLGDRQVKFTFATNEDRILPLLVGFMPILSKGEGVGSGPYKIKSASHGREIDYVFDENYWGKTLPVNKGHYNFNEINVKYYRDSGVLFEAFKAGEYDIRSEDNVSRWNEQYVFPLMHQGKIKKLEAKTARPPGMFGLVFNTRRPLFKDRVVRQALFSGVDFEWLNRTYFHGGTTRTHSYFSNSPFASQLKASSAELKILEPFKSVLPKELFAQAYATPSGSDRCDLQAALALLQGAGWSIQNNILTKAKQPFTFEILLASPEYERLALSYAKNLERIGIKVKVRTVDATQYESRLRDFQYDAIIHHWNQSMAVGRELYTYWGSKAATETGSKNYAGIQDPVVDALIRKLTLAKAKKEYISTAKALDRVLLFGHYVVPFFYHAKELIAYQSTIALPLHVPASGFSLHPWWTVQTAWYQKAP